MSSRPAGTRSAATREFVMQPGWYDLRGDGYGNSTRRHSRSACARITCARKMGPHGNPDVTAESTTRAAAQAGAGEGARPRPGPTGAAPQERRRSERDTDVRPAGGDPCRLLLSTGTEGDAQSVLARKCGSPRLAAKPSGASWRSDAVRNLGMTVTAHACLPLRPCVHCRAACRLSSAFRPARSAGPAGPPRLIWRGRKALTCEQDTA